jgi:hypothetical protein
MPILVVCQTCNAKLNAPDAAAGKGVRCPKAGCGAVVPVPAVVTAEMVEEPAKPVKATVINDDEETRPRKRRCDDDEDDDRPRSKRRRDDDDDRPRKKFRKSGMGTGVIVAIVLGSILVLGGIGYGIYALVSGSGPKSPPPAGWKEYTYKEANFKAYFPSQPAIQDLSGMFGGMGADIPSLQSGKLYHCIDSTKNAAQVEVIVIKFTRKLSSSDRSRARADFRNGEGKGGETHSVRWLGESADEVTNPRGGTTRFVIIGDTMFVAKIMSTAGRRVDEAVEKGFFDNIQLLK